MTNALSTDFYFMLAFSLLLYAATARGFVFMAERFVYTETHPGHFTTFLEVTAIVAAAGFGFCLSLGSLMA